MKRFNNVHSFDVILLEAVRVKDAHNSVHLKEGESFESVLNSFINAIPQFFDTYYKPSLKSIRDHFTRLEEKRYQEVNHKCAQPENVKF